MDFAIIEFIEGLLRRINPHSKRLAQAPAVCAAATQEPVRREKRRSVFIEGTGPKTSTPGAARSGLIRPLLV